MKFAKKIFVGIIAVALLVSCLAVSASAEAPELPVEKLSDVFEYLWYDTYLIEDYEGQTGADYSFAPSHFDKDGTPYFSYLENESASSKVVTDGANKYLSITNSSAAPVGYKLYFEEAGFEYFVVSFDFKAGESGAENGSDIFVKATLRDYYDDVTLFAANTAGDKAEFLYSEYNSDRVTYVTKKADAVPVIGEWYHVDVIFSPEGERYSVSVSSGESEIFSFEDKIDKSIEGIDSIRLYVSDPSGKGETKTAFDNVIAYEGNSLRDVKSAMQTLSDLAVAIDAYAKHPSTPLEAKIEVADFYAQFYEGKDYGIYFEAPEGVTNYAEVAAVVAGAKAFRNQTYVSALVSYVDSFAKTEGYYAKLEYRDAYAKEFYNMFSGADYESWVGVDPTDVSAALEKYEAVEAELEMTAEYSVAFVKLIEENYNSRSKDYRVMTLKYASMAALADKVDPEFKYSDVKDDTAYPTVADALSEYKALETKISEISKNAGEIFIPTVSAMEIIEAESVSASSPYLTVNFEELYEGYLTAKSVYSNGTVHSMLDPATYPGLSDAIAEYLAFEAYINERIIECNEFIAAMKGAETSSYIVTIEKQLEVASEYFDSNKEKSLEKYEGVEDAVASYDSIVKKISDMKSAAEAYIAAVNAIDLNASYEALRTAVGTARELKAKGSVTGYPGVDAADKKFAEADAKIGTLEGYSATLIAKVAALKDAATLNERRALIYEALAAKAGADDRISGVSAAKAELDSYIAAYNADVAAANSFFAGVVADSSATVSSVATGVNAAVSAVAGLVK